MILDRNSKTIRSGHLTLTFFYEPKLSQYLNEFPHVGLGNITADSEIMAHAVDNLEFGQSTFQEFNDCRSHEVEIEYLISPDIQNSSTIPAMRAAYCVGNLVHPLTPRGSSHVVAKRYAEHSATFASLNANENGNCSETDQNERHAVEDQGDVRCFIGKGEAVFCARFHLSNC